MSLKRFGVFTAKKLIRAAILVVVVSTVAFALSALSPVDPLSANVGANALGSMSAEQIEKLESYWGTDTPALERYLNWAGDFIKGDMGTSLLYRMPVSEIIGEKLAASLPVMITAWVLSGILGFAIGAFSGSRPGSPGDKIARTYCVVISGTPSFWIAILAVMFFSIWLGIFPVSMSVPAGVLSDMVTLSDRLKHAVLPVLVLTLTGVAQVAMHTREKVIETYSSDMARYARMRGESGRKLFFGHVLRHALLPAVTLHMASLGELIGGTVLVEQVFSYPGLGQAAVNAGVGGDLPLLLGITVVTALMVFGANLAADIIYRIVDPRMRRGGSLI